MSERGLILALQRLHDDPGFFDMAAADPDSTIGIYDLDDEERQTLIRAVQSRDNNALRQMASQVGIDWTAGHVHGVGSLSEEEAEVEAERLRLGVRGPNALTGDGYEGVMPQRPAGT